MSGLHPYPMGPNIIDFGLLLESLNLQITNDCCHGPIMGHNDKSSTGAPPVSRNAWKRAGCIGDRFRLGENQGVEALVPASAGRRGAGREIPAPRQPYFVVRL